MKCFMSLSLLMQLLSQLDRDLTTESVTGLVTEHVRHTDTAANLT